MESSADAIITKDRDAVITSWNPAAERIYGYSAREAIGRPITMLVPPRLAGEERRILDRILAGDRIEHYETERLTKDGRVICVSISVSPVRSADGQVLGASVIARDITSRRRLQRAQRFLAQAGALLDRSLDPHETLQSVAQLVVPDLGELSVIDLLHEDGHIEGAVAAVAKDPADAEALERLRRDYPLDPTGPHPVARVLRTQRAEVLPELPDETLREIAQGEEHLEFMRRLRYRSALVAPLQARGRTLGALSILHLAEGGAYGPEDLVLAEELARRAALALDNARLYAQLAQTRETDRFLSEASLVLGASLDYEDTLRRVAELAIPGFADWCVVDVVNARGALERVALAHRDADRVALAMEIERRYPRGQDEPTGVPNVIRTGEPELYSVITDEMLTEGSEDEEHLAALRQLGMESALIVPMVARQRTLGAITLVSSTPGRHFDVDDLAWAEELGRRAGVAVENAGLYSERTRVAQTLQASLLPRALPHIPGIELASRFRPAGEGLEVGGDFYDVFPAADGKWMAVIGDVCGKGAEAAGLTALARYTVRSLAQTESRPGEVLSRLNQAVLEQEEALERFLTVLLASLEVTDECVKVRLAAGGHPHPLWVRADGHVEVVPVPGVLVGLFPDAVFEECQLELAPDEGLVLYTDGLTDAQAPDRILSSQDVAMRLEVAGARSAQEVVAAAEELASGAGGAGPRDDIALLAIHAALDGNGEASRAA
ncbi:MAG: SpoIIE family protein phosphatase [Actinomycetota bacterium]|nr:SpoIIE family protein phosphatase [Actinomycetota bacterium]